MPRVISVNVQVNDVKQLLVCKQQLDAVIAALNASKWPGSSAAIAALGPVDLFICDLFNRCEKYWLRYLNRGNPAPAAPTPSDPCPQVSEGSPAGAVQPISEVK